MVNGQIATVKQTEWEVDMKFILELLLMVSYLAFIVIGGMIFLPTEKILINPTINVYWVLVPMWVGTIVMINVFTHLTQGPNIFEDNDDEDIDDFHSMDDDVINPATGFTMVGETDIDGNHYGEVNH